MEDFEDYEKELRTIDILAAGRLSLTITVAAAVLFGVPFYFIWKPELALSWQQSLLFVLLFIVGIAVHELIHGFFFGLFAGKGFKSIRFGVIWEMLTPYCHCKEPLRIKHYFLGALMPGLLLGIIPATVSLFNGSGLLLLFGIIYTGAAAGDFLIVWVLRKEQPETYVQDHPSEVGCFVYRKSDGV